MAKKDILALHDELNELHSSKTALFAVLSKWNEVSDSTKAELSSYGLDSKNLQTAFDTINDRIFKLRRSLKDKTVDIEEV